MSFYILPFLLGRAGPSWPSPKRRTVWLTVLWIPGEFMLGTEWSYFTISGVADSIGTVFSGIFYLSLKKRMLVTSDIGCCMHQTLVLLSSLLEARVLPEHYERHGWRLRQVSATKPQLWRQGRITVLAFGWNMAVFLSLALYYSVFQ